MRDLNFFFPSYSRFKNKIGVDFYFKFLSVNLNSEKIKIELFAWDVNLADEFKQVRIKYTSNTSIYIFILESINKNVEVFLKYLFESLIYHSRGEILIINQLPPTASELKLLNECINTLPLNAEMLDEKILEISKKYLTTKFSTSYCAKNILVFLDKLAVTFHLNLTDYISYEDVLFIIKNRKIGRLRYDLLYTIAKHDHKFLTDVLEDEEISEEDRDIVAFILSLWRNEDAGDYYIKRVESGDLESVKEAIERLIFIDIKNYAETIIKIINKRRELKKWGLELLAHYSNELAKDEKIREMLEKYNMIEIIKKIKE